MSITLSRFAQKKLKQKKYVPIVTSFITDEGPAVGTIWWNESDPTQPPLIVKSVVRSGKKSRRIVFNEGKQSCSFDFFMKSVEIGFFILIGVTPLPMSHTEI